MAETLTQFLNCIGRSGLISRSQLDRESRMQTGSEGGSAKKLGRYLVKCGLLTEWQVENLMAGKYKGFFLGDIKILNLLRSNAQTRVYLAEDQRLQRQVAVKILRLRHNTDSQKLERFHRSVRAMARMTHTNIVQAMDAQVDSGVNYVVVEHFDGETLASFVARLGRLDLELAIRLLLQMVQTCSTHTIAA